MRIKFNIHKTSIYGMRIKINIHKVEKFFFNKEIGECNDTCYFKDLI